MGVLDNLVPEKVFYYFEELCNIPHGSKNTKAISDYCVNFAKERGLAYHQDASNNIIILKNGSKGYEDSKPVIIQGHLDMVCEKEKDCTIDFEKDGLDLAIDGDYIYAKGTTLGGDDGIAVAMALAILDDDTLEHPPIEAVFTVDEALEVVNAIASEHLEIVTANPFEVMTKVRNAGAIFIGEYSSEPLGDYFAGPNHVLPTNGTAKFFSPLNVDDFVKKSSIIYYSKDALKAIHNDIETFAKAEGLTAHANSIAVRFEEEE